MNDKKGGNRVEGEHEIEYRSISTTHYRDVLQSSSGKEQGKNPQKEDTSGCPKKTNESTNNES